MKYTLFIGAAILTAMVVIPACKKKGCTDPVSISYDSNADKDDGSCEYAGTGGNTTIVAFPQHHGQPIISGTHDPDSISHPDSAYVKFNATESPGTSPASYDLRIEGEIGENHVHIPGLKPGKYFIYMTGYDGNANKFVRGGIPYVLNQATGEVDLNIPVSEQ